MESNPKEGCLQFTNPLFYFESYLLLLLMLIDGVLLNSTKLEKNCISCDENRGRHFSMTSTSSYILHINKIVASNWFESVLDGFSLLSLNIQVGHNHNHIIATTALLPPEFNYGLQM